MSGTKHSFSNARFFTFASGEQIWDIKAFGRFAWAVHDGDVVPPYLFPATVWLLGSALLGLFGITRRKQKAA